MNVVELAVREQAGPADAAQDIARLAALALPCVVHGAASAFRPFAFIDDKDSKVRVFTQIIGCKQSGRSSADNDDVKIRLDGSAHARVSCFLLILYC